MIDPTVVHHAASPTLQHLIFLHLRQYRYWLILLGTFLEGEIVLMSASVLAYFGILNIWLVVLAATVGTALSSGFWYWVGRKGGEPFIHRYGAFVGLSTSQISRAHAFLEKYGSGAVVASKFVFGTKILCALFAGALGMSPRKFHTSNIVGAVVWAGTFAGLAYAFARSFRLLRSVVLRAEIVLLILVALAVIISVFFISYRKYRKDKTHG